MESDPHRVLGLSYGASREDIKRAFREKAMLVHPDRPGGSEAQFRALNEAYQALMTNRYKHNNANSFGGGGNMYGYNNYASAENFYARSGFAQSDSFAASHGRTSSRGNSSRAFGQFFSGSHHWRMFVASGSAAATAVIAGITVAAVLLMEPIMESIWQQRNEGKLFHHLEKDILARSRSNHSQLSRKQLDVKCHSFAAAPALNREDEVLPKKR